MIADILLALGLILSLATQLRPVGRSIGPGEIFLALWLMVTGVRLLLVLPGLRITPAARTIGIFWLVMIAALSIGTLMSFATGIHDDTSKAVHDVIAYTLVALIGLFCSIDPLADIRLRRVTWAFTIIGSLLLIVQLAIAYGPVSFPRIDPWYYDRLRGFSTNPNQLALACVVLAFMALHLAESGHRRIEKVAGLLLAVLPLVTGYLTKSDSFQLVLALALPGILALKAWKSIRSGGSHLGIGRMVSLLALIVLPIVLLTAVPAIHLARNLSAEVEQRFVTSNKTALTMDAPARFQLWHMAVIKGLRAEMLGLGPGPHLDHPRQTSVEDGDVPESFPHFSVDPKPAFETHNTVLDLFVQGGLLAVIAFLWLVATSMWRVARTGLSVLPMLLGSLVVFSMFHYIVRHPVLWFVVVSCLVTTLYSTRRLVLPGRWKRLERTGEAGKFAET